jgi:hypothetical protein
MKKILICILAFTAWSVSAQNREVRNADSFNKISFGVPGKAYVSQGSIQKVELEGSSDVLDRIEVVVEGSQLKIRSRDRWDWNWGREDRVTVYITAIDVRGLSVNGSGQMETQTKIVTGDLGLKVSGSGSLKADVEANDMEVDVSGSGDIEVRGKCNNMDSNISGSGDINAALTVANLIEMDISGSGKFVVSGKSNILKATLSGSGKVSASEMESNECEIRISGSGSADVNVKNELNATISGSGSVTYKGSPNHVNTNSSGSGKMRKIS